MRARPDFAPAALPLALGFADEAATTALGSESAGCATGATHTRAGGARNSVLGDVLRGRHVPSGPPSVGEPPTVNEGLLSAGQPGRLRCVAAMCGPASTQADALALPSRELITWMLTDTDAIVNEASSVNLSKVSPIRLTPTGNIHVTACERRGEVRTRMPLTDLVAAIDSKDLASHV